MSSSTCRPRQRQLRLLVPFLPLRFLPLLPMLAGACIPATNPCDPAADPALQSEGTRIGGVVVDQNGVGKAGVLISIEGRPETQVSGADGSFEIANLPPSSGYELSATPAPPLVGGRISTGALACRGAIDDVELAVIEPPTSPEVELARASGEQRLFAAFGAVVPGVDLGIDRAAFFDDADSYRSSDDVVGDCSTRASLSPIAYRVQVRAPFEAWRDAVLAPSPWITPSPGDATALELDRIDDVCAAAACAQFSYLEPALANENARCVDVIGVRTGSTFELLESFGSYQVRILAEARTPDDLRQRFALPERVLAAAPTAAAQMTLLPTAFLPVVGGDGAAREVGEIGGLVTTAGGRFALVENDELSVIGEGRDTLDEAAQTEVGLAGDGAAAAPQGAYGEDASASSLAAADFTSGATATATVRPLGLLPAGDWVRVIRREEGDAVEVEATIQKVYIGADAAAAESGPVSDEATANAVEPGLRIDPAAAAADGLRAFRYLQPEGSLVATGTARKDAYLLLYGSAFVLSEQAPAADLALKHFTTAGAVVDGVTGAISATGWATSRAGVANAGISGAACAALDRATVSASGVSVVNAETNVSVCYDVGAGLGEDVDLRDVAILDDGKAAASHVISDARNDRVLVASRADLVCAGCLDVASTRPLANGIASVDVGREPVGMLTARVLSACPDESQSRTVILVANHGSGDLSIVENELGSVRETGVVPLPAFPVAFLDDPEGPTCDDPFIWVLADDGRAIPVDMRGEPSAPLCNDGPCEVGTRGRGFVGAVARKIGDGRTSSKSRALIGGDRLLGELGFFRPRALTGAAFADSDELSVTAAPPETPDSGQ